MRSPRGRRAGGTRMLRYLRIKNFVLIRDLDLEFDGGLTAITGETGAGKTIILDALSLVLGERARAGLVREGEDSASVEAIFEYQPQQNLGRIIEGILAEAGIDPADGQLLIKRTVSASGSRCFVNGSPAVLRTLEQLGDLLVDVHGQHEHQSLFRPEAYLQFIDAHGGLEALRQTVAAGVFERKRLRTELVQLEEQTEDRAREIDLLRFEVEEIRAARVDDPDESLRLREELSRLRHVEELRETAAAIHHLVEGDDADEGGLLAQLSELERLSEEMVERDAACRWLVEDVLSARGHLDDVGRRMLDYAEGLEADPERLAEAEERLHVLGTLAHKHGGSLVRALEYLAEAEARLDKIENRDARLAEMRQELARHEIGLAKQAGELSKKRGKIAVKLSRGIQSELRELGMADAVFRVSLSRTSDAGGLSVDGGRVRLFTTGIDQAEFEIAVNHGTTPQPLRSVASGGEISRVMLAIKSVLARAAGVPTMIFDEIDAGVGGRMGDVVGRKLAGLAQHRQLVCITHLAAIASRSDANLRVEKRREGKGTIIEMARLTKNDRVEELVRLLGASGDSRNAVKVAREMLAAAEAER